MQESINTYNYLKFSSLSELNFWDYYTLSHRSQQTANYPFVDLAMVLKQRKEFITIDDKEEYKRCRVQVQAKGVILRDIVLGGEIKTKKQQLCKKNDFLVAEIDAKVGGYGIVPDFLENAIVSSHYFLFEIDRSLLLPEFLAIVVQQQQFAKQVKSTGSTNYAAIRPYHVLGYKIPLPSLIEQEALVGAYNKKMEQAERLLVQGSDLEGEIENFINKELGIKEKFEQNHGAKFYFIDYKHLLRWDNWVSSKSQRGSIFPIVQLSSIIIGKPKYGANVKGVKLKSDTRYIRITDINEVGELNNEFVSPQTVEEQYLLNENDFLIARSGNTVGKTFLYKEQMGRAIYAGYLIKFNFDITQAKPEYMLIYTKSKFYKDWIKSNQRVAGQPNINGQEYLNSPVILPPIEVQEKIISNVLDFRKSILKNAEIANEVKQQAQQEFEQAIFN